MGDTRIETATAMPTSVAAAGSAWANARRTWESRNGIVASGCYTTLGSRHCFQFAHDSIGAAPLAIAGLDMADDGVVTLTKAHNYGGVIESGY